MAEFKSKSLDWLEKLNTMRAQPPDASRLDLQKALNQTNTQITELQAIDACLDPAAIEKIRLAAQGNPPHILSYRSARALSGLKKAKLADLSTAVHGALDFIFSHHLVTGQIEALVDWLTKGNSLETFKAPEAGKKGKGKADKKTDKTKSRLTPTDESPKEDTDLKKFLELSKKVEAEITRGGGQTTFQDELKALLEKATAKTEEDGDSSKKDKKKSKTPAETDEPSWFWKWMVGIKFFSQLKSRVKKGESLTAAEKWVVVLYRIYKFFEPPFKHTGKFIGRLLIKAGKGIWESATKWLGKTFANVMKWAVPLLIICAFIWGAGKVYQYAIVNPLHWVERKVVSGLHWGDSQPQNAPAPVSAPQAVRSAELESSKLKTSNSKLSTHHSPPAAAYQPAVSFIPNPSSAETLYNPKLLEQEIAAIPADSVIRDYVFQPDEGMPADLAVSRLQDLTDEDKYTMMIGGGKVKILSVAPSNTNFTITYKSTDFFGFLGNSPGAMNIFLEDIKYIHINEIDHFTKPGAQPDIRYQCTVVAKGAKYPLTIQCASTDDLENLVSTLEYFIRHSRLGRDAQPGGMPYPDQGIKFNSDLVVTLLWAKSPMAHAGSSMETAQLNRVAQPGASQQAKAGVNLGDHLWSAGKNTSEQQSRKDLEAGLQTLPATLFVVSSSEWDKAQMAARQPGSDNAFRPQLRKIYLQP